MYFIKKVHRTKVIPPEIQGHKAYRERRNCMRIQRLMPARQEHGGDKILQKRHLLPFGQL